MNWDRLGRDGWISEQGEAYIAKNATAGQTQKNANLLMTLWKTEPL